MSSKRFHSKLTLVVAMVLMEWAVLIPKGRDWAPVCDLLYISINDRLNGDIVI